MICPFAGFLDLTGTCNNISFIHHFSCYVWLYYQGCQRWKNKVLISTDSMLIWTDNILSIMVFFCLPLRKIIVLHDRSKFTTRKSCKWWLWPWKHYNRHQKKADVVMLFLSLCVNNSVSNGKKQHFPASVGEIWILAVGHECFSKNPYKNTLNDICLNPHGSV